MKRLIKILMGLGLVVVTMVWATQQEIRDTLVNHVLKDTRDLIRVDQPMPNARITSPLIVRGEARGTWFFEASFPVRLVDEKGVEIGRGVAQAEGEWMTENFVPFSAEIPFVTQAVEGMLILERANPSGLPENTAEHRIPVKM